MMRKKYFFIAALLLAVVVTAGAGCQNTQPSTDTLSTNVDTNVQSVVNTPPSSAIKEVSVDISNFSFQPHDVIVDKGGTVTWKNSDSAPHQLATGSNIFGSPVLNTGDTYKFTFVNSGVYEYKCSIHPSMQGKVIVK